MNLKIPYNENLITILDTSLYKVKSTDGVETEYSANITSENMWEQCGNEGNHFQLMEELSKKIIWNQTTYNSSGDI